MSIAAKGCETRRDAERAGLKAWLDFTHDNKYTYNIIWESLYIEPQLFKDYYANFAASYIRSITKGQESGEIRTDIDCEVLAYTLMGTANFIGLNWSIFKDNPLEKEKVIDSFMKILEGGIFIPLNETTLKDTKPVVKPSDTPSNEPVEKPNPFSLPFKLDLS